MRTLLLLILFIPLQHVWSQQNPEIQDPEAAKVLDRLVAKTKALQSMKAGFELIVEDRKEKTKHTSVGSVILKQNKYKLDSEGSTVFYDGTTMWTYVTANNEVTVTQPKSESNPDFLSNPAGFLSSYKNDYKFRYVRETIRDGVPCHEIDLFPKNLNQPYSRVKVLVNKNTDLPLSISSIGKDGVDYTVVLKNLALNQVVDDKTFVFDATKYRKVEIVDMRGL